MFINIALFAIWIIIPGDSSDMGRFISVVVPMILLAFVTIIFNDFISMPYWKYIRMAILGLVISYSTVRITNNTLLWGGYPSYKDFGEILKNTFYEKSERVIGKPSLE